jgi:hypothetical protein
MGIIEEIEKWVVEQVAAPEWILHPRIADGVTLARRAVAHIRQLEEGHTAVGYDFRWAPDPRGEATAPSTIEQYLELARRIEALENCEEARGRARAAEEATRDQPASAPDMASRCVGCGCFIRVEGARCGVCRGGAPNFTAVIPPGAMPLSADDHKPGAREFRAELDDDMRYESRG